MIFKSLTAVLFLFIPEVLALGWTDPDVEDATINVCVGDDIVIPWNVTLDAGETIDDAKWYYRGDHSEEMIAFMADDQFIVTAPFSGRVQLHFDANAGLVVKTAGLGDRGNYSVEVIIRQAGRDVASMFGHADVLISDPPAADGSLHVQQDPRAVKDRDGNWAVQLTCGTLTDVGDPSVGMGGVEWVTPSGEVHVPSGQSTGANGTTFTLILPNPVQGGSYVCRLPSRHPSTSCLPPGSLLRLNDSLHVDEIRARLSLMEAEQNSLKNDNFLLKAENSRLSGLIQRVGSLELGQVNTTDMVEQLMGQYSGLAYSLQAVQDMRNERGNATEAQQISFHARLDSNLDVQDSQTVVLPDVLLNDGDYYDNTTGVFTAPLDATYFFLLTTGVAASNRFARVYIIADDNTIGYASAHYASGYGDTASGHTIVHLQQGQRVWLRSNGASNLWGAATAFSGVLLSLAP